MSNSYVLVNPHIEGQFKTTIKANNSEEAANMFYSDLSEHFSNAVPSFYFTIQKGASGNGKYYHFKAKESRKKNDVTFSIKSVQLENESRNIDGFKSRLEETKHKLDGGAKKKKKSKSKKRIDDDDSDFDSSSDSDYYVRSSKSVLSQPIYYWWYDPYLYNIDYVYVPPLYSYTTPTVQLSLIPGLYYS